MQSSLHKVFMSPCLANVLVQSSLTLITVKQQSQNSRQISRDFNYSSGEAYGLEAQHHVFYQSIQRLKAKPLWFETSSEYHLNLRIQVEVYMRFPLICSLRSVSALHRRDQVVLISDGDYHSRVISVASDTA